MVDKPEAAYKAEAEEGFLIIGIDAEGDILPGDQFEWEGDEVIVERAATLEEAIEHQKRMAARYAKLAGQPAPEFDPPPPDMEFFKVRKVAAN